MADNVLIEVASRRLSNQVFDASRGWEAAVVEQFNEVAEQFELNEVAGDLPNFGDPKSFNVLSLGRQQGDAVDRWGTASAEPCVRCGPLTRGWLPFTDTC